MRSTTLTTMLLATTITLATVPAAPAAQPVGEGPRSIASPAAKTPKAIVGDDMKFITDGFQLSESYHRADVAWVYDSIFAISTVTHSERFPTASAPGTGRWYLYNWRTNSFVAEGGFGDNVQVVRIADRSQASAGKDGPGAATWVVWEKDGDLRIRRLKSNGTWLGSTARIINGMNPGIATGFNGSEEKTVLFYEKRTSTRCYLYYRFLGSNGSIGPAYVIRSVGLPWHFWHVQASFNPFENRWRVFWDERNRNTLETHMRTKYLRWNGHHSNSTYLLTCQTGGPSKIDGMVAADGMVSREEFAPEEIEFQESNPYEMTFMPEKSAKYHDEGCKRFFASFDPKTTNASHRHLVSNYSKTLTLVNENGSIWSTRTNAKYGIPATGVCNKGWCSYRDIRELNQSGTYNRLTDFSFSDYFNESCSNPNPEAITPEVRLAYPAAIASNDEVAIVLYRESPDVEWGADLYLTVIDD